MVAAKIDTFGGMIPAMDDLLLPNSAAIHSENCWLYSGKIQPLPQPKLVHECVLGSVGKVYRIPTTYSNASYIFDSTWMEFADPFTDVIRAPVFGDTYDRYYWVSSSLTPRYNTKARIDNDDFEFLLGIPAPTSAPGVSSTGGSSGTDVSRAYVVTYRSAYGEEGPPSDPTLLEGDQDDTWTVTLPAPAAGDLGTDRNLTDARIYRTVTSDAGVATYFFVAEVDIATATYDDSATDAIITANDQLETTSWTAPPVDLQGFVMMPNGIVASWRNNELWFSEPYRPHAWPVEYVHTVEYPIVGLGIVNQTLVVCTLGYPVTASGSVPEAITSSKLNNFEPCTSRGSILSAPEGVYYASPNGLVLVNPGRAENITRELISKDRWQQLTGETRFRAARLGTAYYGYGSIVPGVFNEDTFDAGAFAQEDYTGAFNGVLIDPMNQRVGLTLLSSELPMAGVQQDPWSGEVFQIKDNNVYWIDQRDTELPFEVATWRSKKFETGDSRNFGAVKVNFEVDGDRAPALNPVRNTSLAQELAADQYGLVRLYADGRLVMTKELRSSGELFRSASGFKADYWYFELETRVKVDSVQLATTAKELRVV